MRDNKKQKRRKRTFRRTLIVCAALGLATVAFGMVVALYVAYRRPGFSTERILAAYRRDAQYSELAIDYPLDGTLFPPDIASPTLRWEDSQDETDAWVVTFEFEGGQERMSFPCFDTQWTPSNDRWEIIKQQSLERKAKMTVLGVNGAAPDRILSVGSVSIMTSRDEVGAPLFYREVNLPFEEAVKDPEAHICWRFGTISSEERPPIVLDKLPVCGNCHSFSADGAVMGMDVDYANDKGSYVTANVTEEMTLDKNSIITWSEYESEDEKPTFGLLSQVSPDGRYVVSTVKDRSVFVPRDNLAFSQLFFPIQGILVIYDRRTKTFSALPGADDKRFVQSNPTWSPDGKYIAFARNEAYGLENLESETRVLLTAAECREFVDEGKTFLFDLYRIPFNEGKGGKAEPLAGASSNGMSNYFPKYSPDGRWIVFCKAKSYMLLQPDSELHIIPAAGGDSRRMQCNTARMNSWHSWSPNGKWLVFSSKVNSPFTQLFLTHIDELGHSSPPVLLSRFTGSDRAANIPEFVNTRAGAIKRIREEFVDDISFVRAAREALDHGDYELATKFCRKALKLNPNSVVAYNDLAYMLMVQGNLEEAKASFLKILDMQADSEMVKTAHCNLGIILGKQLEYQKGIEHCRQALEIDAEFAEVHGVLGGLLSDIGETDEGKEHLAEAIRLDPGNAAASTNLARVLLAEGKHGQAVVLYSNALKENPRLPAALLGLATLRATSSDQTLRDGKQAVDLATKACELTRYQDPRALDILGMAHAQAGRFADAISAAERALWIARAARNKALASSIEQRIRFYKQDQPFRNQHSPSRSTAP